MIYITEVRMGSGGTGSEHIEAVRWVGRTTPEKGESTIQEMVDWIGNRKGFAHVKDAEGDDVEVHVVRARPPYIRTDPDGTAKDNLLSLPRY